MRPSSVATRLANVLGRDSPFVRLTRPLYEAALNLANRGRGIRWSLNGIPCRIDARQRQRMARWYEEDVARFLSERVRSGDVCVDVGANVGVYVIQMAAWSAPDGCVLAFEPNPAARRMLERHVRMNRLAERVEIIGTAVGAAPGRATMFAADADGMARLGVPNPLLAGRTSASEVEVTSLDAALQARDTHPDWVLIDVEGFEADVLRGANRLLRDASPPVNVVVEFHPSAWADAGIARPRMESLVASLGRRARSLTGQADPFAEHGIVVLERQ